MKQQTNLALTGEGDQMRMGEIQDGAVGGGRGHVATVGGASSTLESVNVQEPGVPGSCNDPGLLVRFSFPL